MTDRDDVGSPMQDHSPSRSPSGVVEETSSMTCACGEADCMHFAFDYPWCRSCGEHHRPPECDVDDQGRALAACGCPWEVIDPAPHRHLPGCVYEEDERDYKTCANCGARWTVGEWHPDPCHARPPQNGQGGGTDA